MFELKTYKNEVWLHTQSDDSKETQDPEAPVQHDKTLQVGRNACKGSIIKTANKTVVLNKYSTYYHNTGRLHYH